MLAFALRAGAADLVIDPTHELARFDPRQALGATIDFHGSGENSLIFTKTNLEAMRSAGFQPLSYRVGTELDGEAWHWNPHGSWSDAAHQQGYWTSADTSESPIDVSFGYHLPRRGNSLDQARRHDYSRIDDGSRATFWKSNPYLDEHYTHESHPQWVMLDLGKARPIDAIRIAWETPYAVDYDVEWWQPTFPNLDPLNNPRDGKWTTFPTGSLHDGHGGVVTQRLAPRPLTTRFVRISMTRSSHTAPAGSQDIRDSLGYAIAEVWLGTNDRHGFHDAVRHAHSNTTQTVIWTSSTDPWHRAQDIDRSLEQLGFDAVERTGLTNGLPMLTPVAVLYDTPDNAAAEIRFLRSRKYDVRMVELGEEPDGQYVAPEDYAALYAQTATAIHSVDPTLRLGGPAFQSTVSTISFWPDAKGDTAWIGRFVDWMRGHKRLDDFNFFSFEWYPVDEVCKPAQPQLVGAPDVLTRVLGNWEREGLPKSIPWIASEYGWSSYAAKEEVDITAALFNADFVADFLSRGGSAAYFYGLEPDVLISEKNCATFGNLELFLSDDAHHIRHKLSAYYGARLLTQVWTQPSGEHVLYAVSGATEGLTAFALRRPDGKWALLAVNKNDTQPRTIDVRLGDRSVGHVEVDQFSPRQYLWHADGSRGYPAPDDPPRHFRAEGPVTLPASSITVITFE